jgi:hypothetical protein
MLHYRESSVFEGARILKPRNGRRYSRRRSIASAKNSAKAS